MGCSVDITYTCGTYHEHKEDGTPHTIKVMALHQITLAEIRRVTQDAKQHTDAFLARAMDKHQSGLKKELSAKLREFVDEIVVHERSEPWKKKNYTQQVDVYFNFVGRV